jgi:glycosyltransferase involved in cell wall biosynthesis
MKLLINTSTLYVGGGLQVALSFIHELINIKDNNNYYIFLSLAINKQINKNNFDDRFKFYLIETSPAKIITRNKVNKILNTLEKKINPDIVFTIFGPSYWKPSAIHLLGFADGWVYNPNSIVFNKLSFIKRIKMRMLSKYKLHHLHKNADYYVLETEDAITKLSSIMKSEIDKFYVVGNTYNNVFDSTLYINNTNEFYKKLPVKEINEFRFMYIAHNHPSKNLGIIKFLIPFLKDYNIKFVLTIDEVSYENLFKDTDAKDYIMNIGSIDVISCPSIYHQCDALFAPTLLETFSAAYPEAMKMNKPILTSEYSFAIDICKDAALYFDPLNPKEIANKIKQLIKNKNLQNKLIEEGNKRLKEFETSYSRAKKYIDICENIIKKENNVQK